jgi:hypothetical protein
MIIPFRLLPLLLFSLFVALALLTEQIGQRLYQPVDAFLGASCVLMIGLGLRRCETWSWWCCVLLWPFQLLMIGTLILLAVVARTLDPAGGLAIVSPLEVALSGAQIIALAAAWLCLLAPSIRAGFVEPLSARPLVNVACYALIVLGLMAVALRGTAIERVGAIASVVADRPGVQRAVDAPADIIWDGAIVDRAASTAAAYASPAMPAPHKPPSGIAWRCSRRASPAPCRATRPYGVRRQRCCSRAGRSRRPSWLWRICEPRLRAQVRWQTSPPALSAGRQRWRVLPAWPPRPRR